MLHGAPRYIDCVADNKLILITLLVKLGVAAAVASALARSRTFQRLFFAERRSRYQTIALLAFLLVPLTLGVWLRLIVPNFLAATSRLKLSFCWACWWVRHGPCSAASCSPHQPSTIMNTWRCRSTP